MLPKSQEEETIRSQLICQDCLNADEDCNRTACGRCATADGCNTAANGECSHAEGCSSKAFGDCSHAEGNNSRAMESNSHAEGCSTKAFGNCSHSEGNNTAAYGDSSHAEGVGTKTRGSYSHAEGNSCEANGESSHAQGVGTKAEAYGSFSTGGYTTAKGSYSQAEGYGSTTNGSYAHAEGYYTTATGSYSHAEGYSTLTEGYSAHAEGYATNARAPYSHSEGYFTDTKSNTGAHIMGLYGDADTPYSWFLGGGTSSSRALAAKILYTGDGYVRNAWHAGGMGYSEMFSPCCGKTIEPGYFVTLENDCIKTASDQDMFVLGVTTVNPGFVANSGELTNNYLTNTWNQPLYEEVVIPEKTDKEGNVIEPVQAIKQPILGSQAQAVSSGYNGVMVTLLGQVLVMDDGTCEPNGCCVPNMDGVATASPYCWGGYKVMKRISDNQILIFFRN